MEAMNGWDVFKHVNTNSNINNYIYHKSYVALYRKAITFYEATHRNARPRPSTQYYNRTVEYSFKVGKKKHSNWEIEKLYFDDEDSEGTENSTDNALTDTVNNTQ